MAYLGHEHIYSFENFITEEDRLELLRFHDTEYQWESYCSWVAPEYQFNKGEVRLVGAYAEEIRKRKAVWPEKSTHPLMEKYGKKIMELASDIYGRTLVHRLEPYLKCFKPGMDHEPHADSEAMDAGVVEFMPRYSPSEFNTPILIEVAANLYLTDDFEGGELTFVTRGLTIKPKKGQLVLFPGGHEYTHGVNMITKGERTVLFSPLTTPQRLLLHMHAYNLAHEHK
jgi:predicted 2-oxoglutarate/Fe(II)-dependent dioxygenase YbiX